jgi:CheY-like chemotaxis protein
MRPIKILLVEDNEGDILLTQEALDEGKILNSLHVVRDGSEALKYLEKQAPYEAAERPDLILLDINMPKKNGHEVLEYIKKSEKLKKIPVIILTTSSAERDIKTAYNNYANCYIVKPVELENFMEMVTKIEDFWVSIVQLPEN